MAALAVGPRPSDVRAALRAPPGGASALVVVLAGVGDPAFVLYPVFATGAPVAAGIATTTPRGAISAPRAPTRGARDAGPKRSTLNRRVLARTTTFDIGRDD
jgi:hypothetical protein